MTVPDTGFAYRESRGIRYAVIPDFEKTGLVRHGFTTRLGGVSEGPFESLNFNTRRGDTRENVAENYSRMCGALGVPPEALVLVRYEHGANVHRVDEKDRGKGVWRKTDFPYCDGLITDSPGVALLTLHADCMGVFLLDPVRKCIGLCHAGWRGVAGGMGRAMVGAMQQAYGSAPSDMLAGISAHIGPCCFEVDAPVAEVFDKAFPDTAAVVRRSGAKAVVDLAACMRDDLAGAGVPPENITVQGECTSCNDALFYSHRRDKGNTGSMASVLMLIR